MADFPMAKSLPPLNWFRAFEVAARRLSFTAAAQELGMTQSAVSQHVKALEMRLGTMLFVRQARGLALTDEGRKLLPQVSAAMETLTAATDEFVAPQGENLLTIAGSVSVTQWVIAPHLAEFKHRAPHIRLRFIGTIWPDDFHALHTDIEIPFGSERHVGRNATLLEPNRLIALKAPGLEGGVHTLPLIESVGTSDGWKKWPTEDGVVLRPEVFVDSYGAALHMAMHGHGVALVTELLAQNAIETGQLVRADEVRLASKEGYYIRTNSDSPAVEAFRDWFMARLRPVP